MIGMSLRKLFMWLIVCIQFGRVKPYTLTLALSSYAILSKSSKRKPNLSRSGTQTFWNGFIRTGQRLKNKMKECTKWTPYIMDHIYLISLLLRCPFRKVTNALNCPSLWIRNVRNDPTLNQSNLLQCLIILLHPTSSLINALKILREEKSDDSSWWVLFLLTVYKPSRMECKNVGRSSWFSVLLPS